ncbi:MAG: helical backbone metal receptor [Bacteroidia bacterium]
MKPYLLLLPLCLLVSAACRDAKNRQIVGQAPLISQQYRDDTGREIRLPRKPRQIVSLAPNITEIVFAIGAAPRLAARSQACDHPAEAAAVPEITTYPALDLEQLATTGADLLLATDEIFTPDDLAQLERTGVPVYLQSYDSLADVYRGIRRLGEMLDQPARAAALADSLQAIEARVADSTYGKVRYRTLVLISADPLKVAGGGGFLNELIEKAGGLNVYAEHPEAYVSTTVEEILKLQPEYLILPSIRSSVYSELVATYPPLFDTPAARLRQVFVVDPDLFYRPGPRIIEGLLSLTHILHTSLQPEVFLHAQ